jgi:hypothetical protein
MDKLRLLDLYHTQISENAFESLKGALPQCRILYQKESGFPGRRGT